MNALEKILYILNTIKDINELKLEEDPILLRMSKPVHQDISESDIFEIINKLEKDEKVLKVIEEPKPILDKSCWTYEDEFYLVLQLLGKNPLSCFVLELTERFEVYHDEIKRRVKGIRVEDKDKVLYKITYNSNREIRLNNKLLISKPNFNSDNDLIFLHLSNNPHRKITIEEIEKKINRKITKKITKIIENLGFKGNLRKLFFGRSTPNYFYFRNPIRQEDLDELGIEKI